MPTFNKEKLLSKSRYINGLQCKRLLWVAVNDKSKLPEVSEQAQARFDEGHLVGECAKKLWPNGIDIQTEDFGKNLEESKKLLKEKKPLFEAAFAPKGMRIYSRADILEPVVKDKWDIIEVKSSTEVKPEHIQDVAFQRYCYEKSGLKINRCFLMHINNEYVRQGELEYDKLFKKEEITEQVNDEILLVPERIKEMLEIIDLKEECKGKIGQCCKNPYECPLKETCWNFPENNVFDLYRGGKKSMELYEKGIILIREIPEDFELNEKQVIQYKCEKNCKPHINKKGISEFLKKLKYPLYFMDFETYTAAIPFYNGLSPYQQIPFQFSVHVVEKEGKAPSKHYSFIAEGNNDPRQAFILALKESLGKKGSIIVYNQSFEQTRLKELAELLSLEKPAIESFILRMVDLLVPFRDFDYYDQKQQGSASIKYVLPALTGKTYAGMEIADGGRASLRYLYITHGEGRHSQEEIKKVRTDLEKYCGLDTEAMILVLNKLKDTIK